MISPPGLSASTLVLSAAGFIATSTSGASPAVSIAVEPKLIWNAETPNSVPCGARISAGKSGKVARSLPAERGRQRELPAGQLHAVAAVAGEADDDGFGGRIGGRLFASHLVNGGRHETVLQTNGARPLRPGRCLPKVEFAAARVQSVLFACHADLFRASTDRQAPPPSSSRHGGPRNKSGATRGRCMALVTSRHSANSVSTLVDWVAALVHAPCDRNNRAGYGQSSVRNMEAG